MVTSSSSKPRPRSRNKLVRQAWNLQRKKELDSVKRDLRFRRRREEDKNPRLREERQSRNIPTTIERKRVWDDLAGGQDEETLGLSVDLSAAAKRRKVLEKSAREADSSANNENGEVGGEEEEEEEEEYAGAENDEVDSMLDEDEDDDLAEDDDLQSDRGGRLDADNENDNDADEPTSRKLNPRSPSPSAASTIPPSTTLAAKFPSLFAPPAEPKVLVTTSLNSSLHDEARLITSLFPNSTYVRRSAHAHAHKFSVREICRFAANRGYTAVVVLEQDLHRKRPGGLVVAHLPAGPTFHFGLSSWTSGRGIGGRGNATAHQPELILNNFRTPLGILTAHLFRALFPPRPELVGRQVVTLHNQRDFVFVRRHRYVFRDRRPSEKVIVSTDGKPVRGVEDIRTGLQEIGPRFTLKLRRIDKGIQRASGQEWEWKVRLEKERNRFQL